MTTTIPPENNASTQRLFDRAIRRSKFFLPLYALVPLAIWLAFDAAGTDMRWNAFGLGALGWIVALALRGPVGALVMKLPQAKAQTIVVGSSGVLEEGVRVALLAMTSATYSWSASVGQGWAAVEVLFTIVNVIAIYSLSGRTDEKATQAKEMLRMQGNLTGHPLWGIVERVFASAFHIGSTLLIAFSPWLVLLMIPVHSLLNLTAVRLAKRSILLTELVVALVGTGALVAGLVALHD